MSEFPPKSQTEEEQLEVRSKFIKDIIVENLEKARLEQARNAQVTDPQFSVLELLEPPHKP